VADSISKRVLVYNEFTKVTPDRKEHEMGQTIPFNTSAQLYENEHGDLAIRFSNNLVFESVGIHPEKGFATEVLGLLNNEERPLEWRMTPYRRLLNDGLDWRLVGSMGFLDGDETKPAIVLDVKPEDLGEQARRYLKPDLPRSLS
jgi:hypothetical protein